MEILAIVAIVTTAWAIVATTLLFWNPIGFPDRGHRLLGVTSDEARKDVVALFGRCGFRSSISFMLCRGHGEKEEVFSRQTLLCDGMTVIHSIPTYARHHYDVRANGASVPTMDPRGSAEAAAGFLRQKGYYAEVVLPPCGPGNVFAFVNSSAFDGWSLTYRLPAWRLTKALAPGGFIKR